MVSCPAADPAISVPVSITTCTRDAKDRVIMIFVHPVLLSGKSLSLSMKTTDHP